MGAPSDAIRDTRSLHSLVGRIREELLVAPPETLLGSEAQLLARFGVSRSSLRQAARLLETEQLLLVRRGIRGGYYVRRPDISAVAQAASTYLRVRKARWDDLMSVGRLLAGETCRRAANNPDPLQRERLCLALRSFAGDENIPPRAFLRADIAVQRELMALADNSILELFQSITWSFGLGQKQIRFWNDPARRARWRPERLAVCEAVLQSDPELAAAFANRAYNLISGWIEEETGNTGLQIEIS
jgi:DNA-binding FadR family transcriptional regulator